jgi:hypothetical protein
MKWLISIFLLTHLLTAVRYTFGANPLQPSCPGCREVDGVDANGVKCRMWICDGGVDQYQRCAAGNVRVCPPGAIYSFQQCSAGGFQNCMQSCNSTGTGYETPQCVNVNTGGSSQYERFCDYSDALCGGVINGVQLGMPTSVTKLCTGTNRDANVTVRLGGCGDALDGRRCVRNAFCLISGRYELCPTPTPRATPIVNNQPCPQPSVNVGSCDITANWDGRTLTVPGPVPEVNRAPFPLGLVYQPMRFSANAQCGALPSNATGEQVPITGPALRECESKKIFGYEMRVTWQCTPSTESGMAWNMGDRAWNIGQVNDRGERIENNRSGPQISHSYETSSYGMSTVAQGPAPAGMPRQPRAGVSKRRSFQDFEQVVGFK